MLKTMRRGLNREDGFSLIELMVVVMIIAILIAIAIPSFLGFRKNAQDRAAQSDLRTVLLAQNAFQLETGAFTTDEADILAFEANAPVGEALPAVEIFVIDGNLCLERESLSGENFGVYVVLNGPTYYGSNAAGGEACATAATVPGTFSRSGWGGPVGGGDPEA
jgi:type IV pilus assembly protein PilA